jgi:hypothetical protein
MAKSMRSTCVKTWFLVFALLLLFLPTAKIAAQDLDANMVIDATMINGSSSTIGYTANYPATGPQLTLTGTLTMDETLQTITNYNLMLTSASGTTDMSSASGGIASVYCWSPNNCNPTASLAGVTFENYQNLIFTEGGNSVNLTTIGVLSEGMPDTALCPTIYTVYSTGQISSPPCAVTSYANLNGTESVIYTTPASAYNGTTNLGTSGTLDATSFAETPELPPWMLLVAGAGVLAIIEMLRRR